MTSQINKDDKKNEDIVYIFIQEIETVLIFALKIARPDCVINIFQVFKKKKTYKSPKHRSYFLALCNKHFTDFCALRAFLIKLSQRRSTSLDVMKYT